MAFGDEKLEKDPRTNVFLHRVLWDLSLRLFIVPDSTFSLPFFFNFWAAPGNADTWLYTQESLLELLGRPYRMLRVELKLAM